MFLSHKKRCGNKKTIFSLETDRQDTLELYIIHYYTVLYLMCVCVCLQNQKLMGHKSCKYLNIFILKKRKYIFRNWELRSHSMRNTYILQGSGQNT